MWGMHYGSEGWIWMGFMMAIVWLPLIAGGFWLVSLIARNTAAAGGTNAPASPPPAEFDARELARRASARGEMDRDRFLQTMQDLDAGGVAQPGR